jgi:hypothetical protein
MSIQREVNLPIKIGERPLFEGLNLVETIYRDYKISGNEYETISTEDIIIYVAKIGVLGELLRLREQKNIRSNSQDIFHNLGRLPLFFDEKKVKEWEVNKKWKDKTFCPYPNVLLDYERKFDTLTPSVVYQLKGEENSNIWFHWMINTPINELLETIKYSCDVLLKLNSKRQNKSHLEKNIKSIGSYLNLSEKT